MCSSDLKQETVVNFIKKQIKEKIIPTLKEVDEKYGAYVIQHENKDTIVRPITMLGICNFLAKLAAASTSLSAP